MDSRQIASDDLKFWARPKSRSLTASSDLRLYYEALMLAKKQGFFSKSQLREELSDRVKGLFLIKNMSPTGLEKLISELKAFNWIKPYINPDENIPEKDYFTLSGDGESAVNEYQTNKRVFLRNLITKMHHEYTIPGWFVDRLWKLNPNGQGQVIIPAPLKSWNPSSKSWEDKAWNAELTTQTNEAIEVVNKNAFGSFPINHNTWLKEVRLVWDRLSNFQKKSFQKTLENKTKSKQIVTSFSPRQRLTWAMREAAVKLLFASKLPGQSKDDFDNRIFPLQGRTYMAWCPRLDELELIFYTDFNPKIPGRILFPVSVFKDEFDEPGKYETIGNIRNLNDESLYLHRPEWMYFKNNFFQTLFDEHQKLFRKTKALYVSVQDLRDEVCRILRISSNSFNEFLEMAFDETLRSTSMYTISLETDIREDQRSGYQLLRRSVIINSKIVSLIAITIH